MSGAANLESSLTKKEELVGKVETMGTFGENERSTLEVGKGNERRDRICFLALKKANFKNLQKKYVWFHDLKYLKHKSREKGCFLKMKF